jgi:hypothetical protein
MKRTLYYAFCLIFILCSACYYDKEANLYPGGTCQAVANPTFSANVLPLLNAKCNSCHAGAFASASIRLDSYAEVSKYVVSGSLMGSINHTSGFSPMPKNSSKMLTCEINKIQDWINSGALNN